MYTYNIDGFKHFIRDVNTKISIQSVKHNFIVNNNRGGDSKPDHNSIKAENMHG